MGYETADDAGVFRLDEGKALVQTVDFFTPVVDDPYTYGAVAAANSLSDIYAMGGQPTTALTIACFPEKELDLEILAQIMTGGVDKLKEAGVAVLGGHTVSDSEIKFGYSITGLVNPNRIIRNAGALPGDELLLTKPLGIGILTSGIKFQHTPDDAAKKAIEVMTLLNRNASEVMLKHDAHAATDITGNGLLGHAFELAEASHVTLRFSSASVPYIQESYSLAEAGLLPKTIATTWKMIERDTRINASVSEPLKNILLDPQTSGGLLISLNPKDLNSFIAQANDMGVDTAHIGHVEEKSDTILIVD